MNTNARQTVAKFFNQKMKVVAAELARAAENQPKDFKTTSYNDLFYQLRDLRRLKAGLLAELRRADKLSD